MGMHLLRREGNCLKLSMQPNSESEQTNLSGWAFLGSEVHLGKTSNGLYGFKAIESIEEAFLKWSFKELCELDFLQAQIGINEY